MRESQRVHPRQLVGDVGQGLSWLKKDRRAFLTIILMAITSLVAQALLLMFLTEAHSYRLSTLGIGIVLAASGAGGAAGSIFSRLLPDGIDGFWLPIQMVAWSVALAVLAVSGGFSVFWSALAMLILGATGALGNISYGTYLVSNVADHMIAKITGLGGMLAIGAAALGPVLGGAAVQRYGVHDAIEILLGLVALLVFFSLLTPEATNKIDEIYQSVSDGLPFSRTLGVDLLGGPPASTRFRRERNCDSKGEFFGRARGVLVDVK